MMDTHADRIRLADQAASDVTINETMRADGNGVALGITARDDKHDARVVFMTRDEAIRVASSLLAAVGLEDKLIRVADECDDAAYEYAEVLPTHVISTLAEAEREIRFIAVAHHASIED